MVMMGQQLMDSERKQEDDEIDEYVIKPHNNRATPATMEGGATNAPPLKQLKEEEGMREVPTLAALAQLTHQKQLGVVPPGGGVSQNGEVGEGDNNNQIDKQVLNGEEEIGKGGRENEEDGPPVMNGVGGGDENHLEEQDQPSNCQTSSGSGSGSREGGGETTTTSSGRTSSCDSSGIGNSLTSSSSSEPIEREEVVVSPNTELVGRGAAAINPLPPPVPPTTNGGASEIVPENGSVVVGGDPGGVGVSIVLTNSCSASLVDTLVPISLPNGVPTAPDSCQVIMLAQDFNEQMTAAAKFRKMVRDGINENGKTQAATAASASSRLRGGDSSADEDSSTTISNSTTPNSKSTILNVNTTPINGNTNGVISNGGSATKEQAAVSAGRALPASLLVAGKLPLNVPVLAAVLGGQLHTVLEKEVAPSCVQEVWAHNLLEEFAKIRKVVKKYNFIAMDTEFPGIVVRPQCAVRGAGVFPYELLKVNVDRLKIIQLGVTFMDKHGKCPPGVCTWQFNFKFSLNKDLYASDSISLLSRCGIQFEKHAEMGIEPEMFGEYFMSSGMVTTDQVTYLTFHSGFDFGYLIKLLSNLPLPENEEKFFEIMKIYFPNVYDLKFLMKSVDLHGGLQDIANQMGQERVGTQHQAGSDSLLTGMTFFKLLSTDVFNGEIDEAKYCGKLYGFHMNEDGTKDEGWSEIAGDNLLDATSPKPPAPTSRTASTSNGTTSNNNPLLHPSQQSSSSSSGNSNSSADR